jgi:hypothetical protein
LCIIMSLPNSDQSIELTDMDGFDYYELIKCSGPPPETPPGAAQYIKQ